VRKIGDDHPALTDRSNDLIQPELHAGNAGLDIHAGTLQEGDYPIASIIETSHLP
jgi:hypothetical protein